METQKIIFAPVQAPTGLTVDAFAALLRQAEVPAEVSSYLETISVETAIPGTKTKIRWHRIAHDGTHNKPDIEKLVGNLRLET